jgi:hypothetical protein
VGFDHLLSSSPVLDMLVKGYFLVPTYVTLEKCIFGENASKLVCM